MKTKFLLVSLPQDPSWVKGLQVALATLGILEITTEDNALEKLKKKSYAFILLDATSIRALPELIVQIKAQWPAAKPFVITAAPDWRVAREVFRAGALDYLDKSMSPEELRIAVASTLVVSPHS